MAGTCAESLIIELFAELFSFCNDWIFAAANFQFVAIGIFKEECVVAGAVFGANFRTSQILSSDFPHQLGNWINLIPRCRPECDPRPVWLILSLLSDTQKIRRIVAADGR